MNTLNNTLATPRRMAKILATLGPASSAPETIAALVEAGVAGFRLNFSHGSHADHQARYEAVRQVAKQTGKHIPLLQDLQGPKIRLGEMAEAVQLAVGATLTLDLNPVPGDATRVSLPHPEILASLQVGDTVLINDGVIRLEVEQIAPGSALTRVKGAGQLSSRKGVNVPGRRLPVSAMTEKDKKDLEFGLQLGVDWVALSFVQTAGDIEAARAIIGNKARIMAKIETVAAVDNLEEIIRVSDGIMVARGDLGVELPTEDVPPLQKTMVARCRQLGKPVVVATQMLESMIHSQRPTRAEASDVANATFDGADCLMLSAESASGDYPVETVATMASIIAKAEASSVWRAAVDATRPDAITNLQADAMALAASDTALTLGAAALVTFTETGLSTLRVARRRSGMPVVALTPHESVARYLGIAWGVKAIVCPPVKDPEQMVSIAASSCAEQGIAKPGDTLVIMAGIPFGEPGSTNMVRTIKVEA